MAADQSRYRVEIIVLTHLQHDARPEELTRLRDHSSALDFLTPPGEGDAEEPGANGGTAIADALPAAGDRPASMEVMGQAGDGSDAVGEPAADPWQEVMHLPEMGPEMQEAWRRLRLSGPFRPLQFLAWEQGGDAPFPSLRVHDFEVVHSEDPWLETREAVDGIPEDVESLPPPLQHYRLDGTARFRRSRFLHLALALDLRTPVFDPATADAPTQPVPHAASSADPAAATAPKPTSFLVHRLEQSRVVATGRMEYFDGPVLGVLAWITDISDSFAEAQATAAGDRLD